MAKKKTNGSVMVVGAGIAGIQASLDLADSGYINLLRCQVLVSLRRYHHSDAGNSFQSCFQKCRCGCKDGKGPRAFLGKDL